jgi:hypothetical protein
MVAHSGAETTTLQVRQACSPAARAAAQISPSGTTDGGRKNGSVEPTQAKTRTEARGTSIGLETSGPIGVRIDVILNQNQ